MKKIEIRYEDLDYILAVAEIQLKSWIKAFDEESDKKTLNKIQGIREQLLETNCYDYAIIENE